MYNILLVTIFFSYLCNIFADSLYDQNYSIVELETNTFNTAVYNTEKAHIIEFYSSWCGACIGYVPTFKKFARHLSTWAPLVQVAVVNCADENMSICREHHINAFPTLKYFKYMAADKNDGLLYQGNKYDLAQLELDIAGLVQADSETRKPAHWPSFLPEETSSSLDQMWSKTENANFLGLAIQESPATMAWANIINFHKDRYTKVLWIKPQHAEAVKHFGTNANGRFLLYNKGNSEPVWTSPENIAWVDIKEKVDQLVTELEGAVVAPTQKNVVEVQELNLQEEVPVNLSQYKVNLVDLQSTISYMLYKEIPRREIIDGNNLAGLKQWSHTLKKYAPGTAPMRRLLYLLDEWLQLQSHVTAAEFIAKVDDIQIALGNPLSKDIKWVACAGTKSHLRGYTCGLWTLAHAITVEAYNLEKNNLDFKPVIEVLEPFRQFITRFLSCNECAQNFQKETEKHQMDQVTHKEDFIIWLWKVHNYVNQRLAGSRSEDPKYPKRQFPPKELCSECYLSDEVFDESKTLDFLKRHYANFL